MTTEEYIQYANGLIKKYNLDYTIEILLDRKHFGLCDYRNKIIYISEYHIKLNTEYEVKRTIIHEIAHAICGPVAKHHYMWMKKFEALLNIELGSNEIITHRFGKGKLPTAAEAKNRNKFEIKI